MSPTHSPIAHDILELYPVFRDLPENLFQALIDEGQALEAPAGQVLFNVESPCQAFPIILAGEIRVERLAESGRKILLYTVQPGDSCILTVSSLLGNSTYPATGTVGFDVKIFTVSRNLFMRLIEESKAFRVFVFQYFSQRITHLMELIENLAWDKMRPRLAAVLARQTERIETTHQALADDLGTVREVVSRILKSMETEGLIKLSRGKIEIMDHDKLEKITAM